jgi:transcriptional regulator with XRE-family HTH domain
VLIAALAVQGVSATHNAGMSTVKPRFKPQPPRHFVRQWRNHRGLTLEELAERVGVTHGALSQLETGRTRYTQKMMEALADALNCTVADLLIRDPSDPEGIWSIWDNAKPGERRQIVEVAKTLLKTGT